MRAEPDPGNPSGDAGTTSGAKVSERRALLFRVLSGLWIFPSFGACWILWGDPAPWQQGITFSERLDALKLEQWCALLLLLVQVLFVILAMHFRPANESKKPSDE